MTPTTGTVRSSWSCGIEAEVAALQATTISFTSWPSRKPPISRAKRLISASGRGPYGRRAWSPRYTKSSCGIVTRHSWRTVRPPTPESNTPTGLASTGRIVEGRAVLYPGAGVPVHRLVVLAACGAALLGWAGTASAAGFDFNRGNGAVTMDDGVSVATTLYTPAGAPPTGGWPAIVVLPA